MYAEYESKLSCKKMIDIQKNGEKCILSTTLCYSTLIQMSILPTNSSITPMSEWFANMNQIYHVVQTQATIIQNLQERIAVLENRAEITTRPVSASVAVSLSEKKKDKDKKNKTKSKAENKSEGKKRGRKPSEYNLSDILREGEQVVARVPLGNRRFDEHAATVRDGKLSLEDGQTFDHPTTMVAAIAKMLEDIGERSSECSKSMNGWTLCTVSREGKHIVLEKLKNAAEMHETDAGAIATVANAAT
jgi:hypothetical protein